MVCIMIGANLRCYSDLQTTHKRSHPKAKGTKMLMILEALQMQCYDAMRDLRVKIGVLQMPLFKVIIAEEVKVKIFVSTR